MLFEAFFAFRPSGQNMQVFFLCCSAQVWSLPRYGCGRDYSLPAILEPFKARVFRALLASCRMTASGHGPSSPLRETMVGNGIKSGGSGREAPLPQLLDGVRPMYRA